MREILTLDYSGRNTIEVSESVKFSVEYYNFDIPLTLETPPQKVTGTKDKAISAVVLNDGDLWVEIILHYSDVTGSIGNINSQNVVLAPYQYLIIENFPIQYMEIQPASQVQQSPYGSSTVIIRGLIHGKFPTYGRVSTDLKTRLIAYDLLRSQISVNPNSSQNITVGYITPLKGKLKLLIFPSAPVTASLSLTDMITQQTFTVNVNSGNSVYGEYEMDISKLMQINSITLTNNNSSSVSGYLILLYEVG
jgi:hypothetical protein